MSSLHFQEEWALKTTLSLFYIKGRLGWKGLRASEFIEEGPYLVTGTDFEDGKVNWGKSFRISMERYLESPEISLKEDDILITKDGTIGKVAYIDHVPFPGMASLNSHLFLVRSKTEGTSPRYCYYVFQSEEFRAFIESKKSGSTLAGLPQRVFEQFEIPLPQFGVQSKIANILSTVDNLIEKTQALIYKYQSIKQGMMHDLFTRGVDEHGQLRPSYEEAPHLYKESEVGWIPKEWGLYAFGDLAEYVNGNSFNADTWSQNGLPIIRIQNINGSQDFNYYEGPVDTAWEVLPDDLLFAWSGTLDTSFGPALWRGSRGVLNQHIFKVTENKKLITKNFLYFLLKAKLEEIVKNAHGFKSSFVHITRGELTSVICEVPTIGEQQRINSRIDSLDRKIELEKKTLDVYQMMKNGLMQDLLTGKVRVKVDSNEECVA